MSRVRIPAQPRFPLLQVIPTRNVARWIQRFPTKSVPEAQVPSFRRRGPRRTHRSPPPHHDGVTEERRLVSVLFADVVGSTALGEALDPEDVRALLGRMFAIAREAIERHGGTLEKFIGDAVMAVFGLPTAHDDDPARACAAALEFRDRVRDDPVLGHRLEIRLGVNTGEVIASRNPGANETLVTGDAVNTAARLEQAADAGAILVGERTVAALGGRFRLGAVIEVAAKGKAEPVRARPLEGAEEAAPTGRRHRLVGRAADLSQLRLAADRAFDERRPFLVSVIAAAGVGKSRLLEEFLDGLDPATTVALAQCLPYGQRLTYWPLRSILLSILRLGPDAPPEVVRTALASWIAESDEPDTESMADLIAATVGAAEAEVSDRIAVFAAWRRFVEIVAERTPLVLVIEDLHWSSDSLLDLVESMLQPRADVPLLMIALARPELLDRRPTWSGGRRNAISIDLEPLPERAVRELVADLLDDPAPSLVQAIVDRADGNPFFAGEIVRSLADAASTRDADAIARAVAAIPDTVHGTVLARLDGLDPTARRVVQLGAVIGRSFDPRALPALEPDLDETAVAGAVDDLVERDFVRRFGGDTVTFRHILIREVAYGTLPRRERARLHAAAGTWLERQATAAGREDELAELVAFHLREAAIIGSLVGATAEGEDDQTRDLHARAVRWLRRAAEVANAGAATPEADRHLQAAIELSAVADQAELYERLGQIWVGNDQGLRAFERALALGQELGLGPDQELRTMAQSLIVVSRWSGSIGLDFSALLKRFDRLRELVQHPDASVRSRALGNLAIGFGAPRGVLVLHEAVEPDRAALDVALELARELDDPDLISAVLDAIANIATNDDQIDEAIRVTDQRRAFADRLAYSERLDLLNMTAWLELLRGRLEVSERASAQAREGLSPGQASVWTMGASAWRTLALQLLGRWPDALTEAARIERDWADSEVAVPGFAAQGLLAARAIARAQGDGTAASHWQALMTTLLDRLEGTTRLHRLRADLDDDLAGLHDGVLGNFHDYVGRMDYVHLAMSRLTDVRYPSDPALLETIVTYAEPRHLRIVEAAARRALGVLRGDAEQLQAALELYRWMGARPFVARVEAEIGLLNGDAGLVGSGIAALDQIGDLEHAARVAGEARARGLAVG
jgi:class 3 adenylate cyclase